MSVHARATSAHARAEGRARAALLALLLIAFALATLRLGAQSLWYDEGVTAMVARKPVPELLRWTAADIQPPLSYLVVKAGGALWGWSEWALRWPSAAAATLAVALLARLAATLPPRRSGAPSPALPVAPVAPWLPVWAAGLLALHPLAVYYAQEARMYALLLALLLAAAATLAPALAGAMPARRWLLYALCALAALYTHYFAAFVLAALLVALLLARMLAAPVAPNSPPNPQAPRPARRSAGGGEWRKDWRALVTAHALIAALWTPWAIIMLQRLGDDASYWQGRLKLGEALADAALRFTGGETVPEAALWPALALFALTVAGVLLCWRRAGAAERAALAFALLWLALPVVAVLALASLAPKFNARYLFAALPALILTWALLLNTLPLNVLLRRASAAGDEARQGRAPALLTLALLSLLAALFLQGNLNWFTRMHYAKAQWRQLVEFLRPRLREDEAIFLVSGHAWPVWDYYAPDLPATRLPNLDVLDVNHVLTFAETAPPMRAALAALAARTPSTPDSETDSVPGAWLVAWQDEVVDPNEVVPVQLELGGREKGSSAQFNQLTLRRWSRVRDFRIAETPPVSVPVGARFGQTDAGQTDAGAAVTLAGYHTLDNGDLLLFWQAGAALNGRDLHVTATVEREGEGGPESAAPVAIVQGRRLAGYNDPSFRWQPGAIVMGRIPAAAWLGPMPEEGQTPAPGSYRLTLRVYDGADPAAAPLPVTLPVTLPEAPPDAGEQAAARATAMGDALLLEGVVPVLE